MRTLTIAAILLIAAVGCGDSAPSDNTGGLAGAGGIGGAGGEGGSGGAADAWELVICDEVEVVEGWEGMTTTRYRKAVYPGVQEGTATFRFCDVWTFWGGSLHQNVGCNEGDNPAPGFYQDGDLHVVCSALEMYEGGDYFESGTRQLYVRFGE